MVFAGIISIVFIMVGFLFYRPGREANVSDSRVNLEELVKQVGQRTATSETANSELLDQNTVVIKSLKEASTFTLIGFNKYADHEIGTRFLIQKGKISNIQLEISTAPPPELTPEEIIHRVTRRPWLYRAKVAHVDVYQKDDGSFLAEGGAKVTIDHLQEKHRVAANVSIRGKLDLAKHTLSGQLVITRDLAQTSDRNVALVEQTKEGFYKVFVSSQIVAQTVKPPEAFAE
jgi:hypothetical protein